MWSSQVGSACESSSSADNFLLLATTTPHIAPPPPPPPPHTELLIKFNSLKSLNCIPF